MEYYKTIDELLKGIGDISQSAVYKNVRAGAGASQRNIADIASGKVLPYQRELSSENKTPNIINRIASTGTYANPYLSPDKDVSKQYQAFNAGKTYGRPTPAPTPTTIDSGLSSMWNNFLAGVVNAGRSATSIGNVFDLQKTRTDEQKLADNKWAEETAKNVPDWLINNIKRKALDPITKTQVDVLNAKLASEQTAKQAEANLRERADVEGLTGVWKKASQVAGAIPSTLEALIPVYGWHLLATTSVQNSIENTIATSKATGQGVDMNMAYVKAFGDAGIDVTTELMFGAIGGAATGLSKLSMFKSTTGFVTELLRPVTSKIAGSALGQFSKLALPKLGARILTSSQGEGFEELVAYVASGYLAKLTTQKDVAAWGENDQDALMSIAGMIDAYVVGALAAAPTSVIASGVGFVKTREAAKKIGKPVSQFTEADWNVYANAIHEDMQDKKNQEAVTSNNIDMLLRAKNQNETGAQDNTLPDGTVMPTFDTAQTPAEYVSQMQQEQTMQDQAAREASQVAEIKRMAREIIEPTPRTYIPYEEPVFNSPAQVPTSPSQTQDASMPTQTHGAPTTDTQTAGQAFNDAPTSYIRPLSDYAPKMYHETGSTMAQYLIDPTAYVDMHLDDVYMSNDPELALGQGDSKGFVFEFDTNQGLKGRVDMKKPASQQLYKQGKAEFIGRYNEQSAYKKALTAVTIKKNAMSTMSPYVAVKIKKILDTWTKTENKDGSITYTKPEQSVQAQSTTQEAPQTATAASEDRTVSETAKPKKERLKLTNEDGTYNLDNLKESMRRLKIAQTKADTTQRTALKNKERELESLIAYVTDNPAYKKPDVKAMVEEQRAYVAEQEQKRKDTVTVTREIPLNELSTSELVAKVKADYPDPQIAYGQFVKARSLKPEIDAKEFNRIFASVNANRQIEKTEVGFKPTHIDSVGNRKVQVMVENGVAKMVWEDGATGAEPASFFEKNSRYTDLSQAQSAIPTQAQPIPSRPKTVPAAAKKAPEVRMKDMIAKHVAKQDVSKDIEQWVDTEEGQALVGKFKNAEDLGAEIMRLKADVQGSIVTTDEDMAYGYLQMLAYEKWLSRIENVPEGSALSKYMLNMVEAMREGKPKDIQRKLERSVKDSDLFHAVLGNQELIARAERKVAEAALSNGGFEQLGQDLADKMGNIKVDLTPENVLLISMYSKMLMEMGNVVHAARVLKNLSFRMTQAGRFINAAGVAYKYLFPEYQARSIEKEFNRFIEPEQEQKLDEKVKVTADVVRKGRKESVNEAIKETEAKAKEPITPKEQEEVALAQRFAKLLENSLKERQAKEPSADVLLLRRLFSKYKDINKTKNKPFPKNVFEVMTDIIANRADYREVWEGAQDILAKNPDMENVDIIQAFIKTAADPVAAKRFMDSVIAKNVKSMDKSMSQMAREYFFTGEESFDGFMEKLKENMPNLDAASMSYLSRGIKSFFVAQMNQRRQATVDALKKQVERRSARKEDIDAQQAFVNKMMDATYRDALSIPELQDLWAEHIGVPHLSQENIQDIYQTMRDLAKMKTENEKNNAYDALAARLANSIPASYMDKFLAWTRTAMLLNPTTWMRNMLSNLSVTPMYRVSDKIANQMQKTIGVPVEMRLADKSVRRFDATTELGKLVYERTSAKEVDRIMRSSSKYSIAQLMGMERRIFKTGWIEKITKMPGRVMNEGDIFGLKGTYLGDLPVFTKHYRYAMYNKLAALSYSPSMTETQKASRMSEASDYARDYAAVRTFRDRTALSTMITNIGSKVHTNAEIKNADAATAARMIRENKAIKLLVKIVVPFSNTPAAIMREAYRFSPLKMAVSLAKVAFKQKKIKSMPSYAIQVTNELAQSTVGSFASFGLGVVLSMLGILTGPPPENEKEKVAWELEGKRAYSLYIKGLGSFSVDWLQPFSTGLMMGAAVVQASDDPANVLEWLGNVSTSMVDALLANTIIDSVQRQFGASYKSSLEKIRDVGLSALYQSLPGLVKRMNQVIDPYVRDAYSGSAAQQVFNRVVSSLPFGTLLVPVKVDIWGNQVTQAQGTGLAGVAERSVLNLLSPFIKTKAKTDDVTKSVIDTWNATKTTLGNVALPSVPDKSFSVKDGDTKYEYSLSGKEYSEFQESVGKLYYEKAKAALQTASSQMEYEKNAKALESAYEDARYEAKWDWYINHPQQ